MLLNLATRSDSGTAEELLRRSFRQFQMEAALPRKEAALKILEQERDAIQVEDEAGTAEYLLMLQQLFTYKVRFCSVRFVCYSLELSRGPGVTV